VSDAALPNDATAVPGETADACRIQALEDTLRDVLSHIRPQGHPSWELNTCLVTNDPDQMVGNAEPLPPMGNLPQMRHTRLHIGPAHGPGPTADYGPSAGDSR
jgi:hypothetical protein